MSAAVMTRSSLRNPPEDNAAIRNLRAAGHSVDEARAILAAIANNYAAFPTKVEMRDEFAIVSRLVAIHVATRGRLLIRWLVASQLLLLAIMVGIARFTDIF